MKLIAIGLIIIATNSIPVVDLVGNHVDDCADPNSHPADQILNRRGTIDYILKNYVNSAAGPITPSNIQVRI
jgi:hypothetical protein